MAKDGSTWLKLGLFGSLVGVRGRGRLGECLRCSEFIYLPTTRTEQEAHGFPLKGEGHCQGEGRGEGKRGRSARANRGVPRPDSPRFPPIFTPPATIIIIALLRWDSLITAIAIVLQ